MPTCRNCHTDHPSEVAFCSTCGHRMGDSVESPEAAPRIVPPAAPPQAERPALPRVDVRRLLTGNWVGAAITALVMLLVTGTLAGILALLAKPEDFGISNTLTLATVIAAGAFGADLVADMEGLGLSGQGHVGAFPLTVTILACVAGVLTFRRMTSSYRSALPAFGDAARAALLFAVGLTLPTLLFDSDNDELGRGWGAQLAADEFGTEATMGASSAGAFFLGLLTVALLLSASILVRRDWLPAPLTRAHDWAAAPLYGVATTVLLLPVVGLIGLLAIGLFGEATISENDPTGDDLLAVTALIIGLLATGGMWLLGLGAGGRIGGEAAATGEPDEQTWERLWGQVTEDEPGLWIAPLLLVGVLALSAWSVVRHTADRTALQRNLLLWAAGMVVVVPWLARLSGAHAGVGYGVEDPDGDLGQLVPDGFEVTGYFGLDGLQATLLITLVALVVALLTAWRAGVLDVQDVRARLSATAGSIQSNPGHVPSGDGYGPAPEQPGGGRPVDRLS